MSPAASVPAARAAERIPVFDPALHVSPPTAKYADGTSGYLLRDLEWEARVAAYERAHPLTHAAPGDVTRVGEVIVIEGDDETISADGMGGFAIKSLSAVARKVIDFAGDNFHVITLWQTFDDRPNNGTLAFALNVRNEVEGLGPMMPVRDTAGTYGSRGTLRAIVNMKTVGLRAGDRQESWTSSLETWGQETGHRFMVFLRARVDGKNSDILLGRDCAHYQRFVDTQASVHDGFSWTDNGNGTFTVGENTKRFGNLDLYGMGLMPADEMPPFFAIDNVQGFSRPTCANYGQTRIPTTAIVSGTRVNITIDDIVAANGPRVPAADPGYVREAQVVITRLGESAASGTASALAQRIDRARLWWEAWAAAAAKKRLVVCTASRADCGDPRSDVQAIVVNPAGLAPRAGVMPFDIKITNPGSRAATGVTTWLKVAAAGIEFSSGAPAVLTGGGMLAAGQSTTQTFALDLAAVPCGTEAVVTAWTQSDFHYDRRRESHPIGVETKISEDFESDTGWVVNPDGNDTGLGATWERGTPAASFLLNRQVQPGTARGGQGAFVTGLQSSMTSGDGFVRGGGVTLQSRVFDARGLRDPMLRYFVSFAGVRGDSSGTALEASPESLLVVLARAVPMGAAPDAGAAAGAWIEIDRLSATITDGFVARTAKLPASIDLTGGVILRFVAADQNPQSGGVEAAIDDIAITSNLPGCYEPGGMGGAAGDGGVIMGLDDGGCGCRLGAGHRRGQRDGVAGVFLAVLVGLHFAWRNRRRS